MKINWVYTYNPDVRVTPQDIAIGGVFEQGECVVSYYPCMVHGNQFIARKGNLCVSVPIMRTDLIKALLLKFNEESEVTTISIGFEDVIL